MWYSPRGIMCYRISLTPSFFIQSVFSFCSHQDLLRTSAPFITTPQKQGHCSPQNPENIFCLCACDGCPELSGGGYSCTRSFLNHWEIQKKWHTEGKTRARPAPPPNRSKNPLMTLKNFESSCFEDSGSISLEKSHSKLIRQGK